MNSIWFNVEDNEPSDSQTLETSFLGIYSDDPAHIGTSLSRPLTPFENSNYIHQYDHFYTHNDRASKDINESPYLKFAESPPRNVSLNVDSQTKRMFEISIYP